MAEPYGTIAKYRNAFAIKKHNAIIQPWASAMALDVAAIFWATWKGIEERLPEGDEIIEAEKPRDSRDLKNKYSAIIRVEVKRHSAELQHVIENYIYRVWLAGAVEQCRDLGCTGWFFSSLSKSSTSSESASAPDGASLQESSIVFLGTFGNNWQIGAYRSDDGKTKYVAYNGSSYNKFSPTNGVGTPFKDGEIDQNATKTYSQGWDVNKIKIKKQGGDGLPYKTAKAAFDANSSGLASKVSATKITAKTASSKVKTKSVKADSSGWVSLPNLRAQAYAKKHAAEAVTNINDTTRKEIASIVSKGVASGASYNDIAKSIKSKFEEFAVPMPQKHVSNRAVLVAVTELANAYCEGNAQVGNYLQDNGVKMMKAWQTLEDDRVSDGCKENERVGWIPINKEFPSGHIHPPRFPGCRCDYLIEMLDKDFLGKSINTFYSSPVKVEAPAKVQAKTTTKTATKSGVKSATKTKSQASLAKAKSSTPARQATKSVKSSVPSWETWNTKLESRELNNLHFSQKKAFQSGDLKKFLSNGGDKYKKLSGLLKSNDISYSGMSSSQKSALKKYTGNDYKKMNEYLRSNKTKSTGVKKTVENAISAIKEHGITTESLIVNRGFNGTFWNSWSEGEIRQLPEFLSTSISSGFSRDNNVHIYVPPNKGSGIYIDGKSMVQTEYEYLIAPNSKFKVHHIEQNDNGGKDFWLELIPEEK